jgi:hypothetical protein
LKVWRFGMGTDRILRNSLDLGSEVVVIANHGCSISLPRAGRDLVHTHLRARGARIFGFEFRDFASQIVQGALARRVIAAETDFATVLASAINAAASL